MAPQVKPSIVFCHGLWADGSCFSKLIPAASGRGLRGVSQPSTASTRREGRRRGAATPSGGSAAPPSSSATPTAEPSSPPREPTTALPGSSTSPRSRPTRPRPPRASRTSSRSPTSSPTSKSRTGASGCCRQASGTSAETCPSRSRNSSGRPNPPAADLVRRNAPGTAWRSKPSWYIVANNDHTVHPELERFAAKRMGATTYELDSSHVPMLSHPGLVLDVIRAAAAGV